MDVIGRKPVHFSDVDLQVLDRPIADIFEFKGIDVVRALVAHGSNQPGSSLSGQGKDRQEIGLVEIDVQLAVDRWARRFNIGDIEDLPIGASGEAGADRLAYSRVGAVAADDVVRFADFLPTCWARKAGNHLPALV
jgi:hypothetical protein